MKFHNIISGPINSRKIITAIFICLALVSLYRIGNLISSDKWKQVKGDEYFWIAQSIAAGQGFSFSADHRWLFVDFKSKYPADEYYPTAWEEPVYPYLLGLNMKIFGIHGRLLILILQSLVVYFTGFLMYLIARRIFKTELGIVASIIFMLFWPEIRFLSESTLSPAILAGFGLSGSVLMFLWFLDRISVRRGIFLGIALGLTSSILAATQLSVPIIVLITLYFGYSKKITVWRETLTVILAFIVVLLPWTIRNYVVFGEIIPFRNGVGQGLHMSNTMVASTYIPGIIPNRDSTSHSWQASSAIEALNLISTNREKRVAIYKTAFEIIELEAPSNFDQYNEAQRDKLYLKSGFDFIKSHPQIFLNLTFQKFKMFVKGWNRRHLLVVIFLVLSLLLWFRNEKVIAVFLLSLGYVIPFSVIGPWFYRYRYPVEPLFLVLSIGILITLLQLLKIKLIRRRE